MTKRSYTIRPMGTGDISAGLALINHTIRLGGTTAYEEVFDAAGFAVEFMTQREAVSSLVAIAEDGALAGFQCLYDHMDQDPPFVSIGSFTDQRVRYPGAAAALFAATKGVAQELGATYIRALIRSDNVPGLAYYRRTGFQDVSQDPDYRLADGTRVGRVETRFPLTGLSAG